MSALGKMVDSIDVVKATDIPMDGNAYYFPKADGTEVYCKQWLQNGTTRILTFKPVFEDNPNNVSSDTEKFKIGLSDEVTEVLMKRFDELEKQIDVELILCDDGEGLPDEFVCNGNHGDLSRLASLSQPQIALPARSVVLARTPRSYVKLCPKT